MDVLWFIPTHGDGRYLASNVGSRSTTFPYLRQIAQAVDGLGFNGALLPIRPNTPPAASGNPFGELLELHEFARRQVGVGR